MVLLRCLVVDDHQDGAYALGVYLGILGADVCIVFSGSEAIKIGPQFRPHLVVLDVNMPGMNGFETAERLKQQAWAHTATFVAHSAASQDLEHVARAAGFNHFLVKGDAFADFETIVARLLINGAGRLT